MTRRCRAGLAALSFAAAAAITAGCNGDDDVADTTVAAPTTEETTTTMAPITTVTETTTTTTAFATTTTTTSIPDTTLVTSSTATTSLSTITATDWRSIVETLYRRRQGLFAAPDASRVGEVCSTQSECEASLLDQIATLAANAQHVEGDEPAVVRSAEVLDVQPDTTSPALVTISIVYVVGPEHRIVDSAGNTVFDVTPTEAPGTELNLTVLLAATQDDAMPWRILNEF